MVEILAYAFGIMYITGIEDDDITRMAIRVWMMHCSTVCSMYTLIS